MIALPLISFVIDPKGRSLTFTSRIPKVVDRLQVAIENADMSVLRKSPNVLIAHGEWDDDNEINLLMENFELLWDTGS